MSSTQWGAVWAGVRDVHGLERSTGERAGDSGRRSRRRTRTTTIPATLEGYRELEAWARQFSQVSAFGIEGTGSWGAGLVRVLRDHAEDSAAAQQLVPTR
jgi:hypothetical protein